MEDQSFFGYLTAGRYAEAAKCCDDFIEKNPKSALAYCNRALTSYHLELFRKCIKDCDFAIQLDSNCLRAYLRKGLALDAMNKKEEAKRTWTAGKNLFHEGWDADILLDIHRALSGESVQKMQPNVTVPPTKASFNSERMIAAQNGHSKMYAGDDEESAPLTLGSSKPKKLPSNYDPVLASAQVAQSGSVQHGVGNKEIDEKIALGYLYVNTGEYQKGMDLFNSLLQQNPQLVAAYLGRGTAFALIGGLDQAIADFTASIQLNPRLVDGWKRRGQTKAAKGLDTDAISDLTRAIELDQKDPESFHQRGLVHHKQRNFKRAIFDFKKSTSLDKMNKQSWNHLGLCLNAVGLSVESIDSHARATAIDPKFREAWANMAQAYKDLGVMDKAEQLFEKALSIDPNHMNSYHLRALLRFGTGDHKKALEDLSTALKIDPKHSDSRHMLGVANHGLGAFRAAVANYDILIDSKADHVAWYQREVALFVHANLDRPMQDFNIDVSLDTYFKESWCKRNHPATLVRYKAQSPILSSISDVSLNPILTPDGEEVVKYARYFGGKIQYSSPGYLPNKRQHAMCGLATLELAQRLQDLWLRGENTVHGRSSSHITTPHEFGWRDMYDIIIKWRQLSEPNDPVWWVDLLSPEQFEEGFGSHTPMLSGQTQVVRYYPMFERSLGIMKKLMPEQSKLTDTMKAAVENAKDCKDLYDIMRRDFWVITPCQSSAEPGAVYEGTRLTCQYVAPEGYEYSIRTPGTPARWVEYDKELTFAWNQLNEEVKKSPRNLDRICDSILMITFYWYNFMPLSRGTAAAGYISLMGMLLALGYEVGSAIPKDFQCDWEGILRPNPQEFIGALSPWLYPARKPFKIDSIPSVTKTFSTPRLMIEAMTAYADTC